MLTKQHLQEKQDNLKLQIEQSLAKINETKNILEQLTANHNALLGAQILSTQLLGECDDIVTPPQAQSREPEIIDGAQC